MPWRGPPAPGGWKPRRSPRPRFPSWAAADLPKLDPNDPSAKALLYVPDAKNVDTKNPMAARYAAGQTCSNCQVIQGKDGEAYRPCAIFPGKLVAAAGWCSAWAKKA